MFRAAASLAPALKEKRLEKRLPVVGPSSQSFSQQIHPERSVNFFPIKPEREGEPWVLRATPGIGPLTILPRTPIRGMHVFNGRFFAVAGPRIYEVQSDGTTIRDWGAIVTSRGKVTIASILSTIVIGDGSRYYALDLNAATVSQIVDAPKGRFCVFFNQRILYQGENGQVFYSELNDPTNIPGANLFTAESLPDEITSITTTEDQIWLHGPRSNEVWYDSGDVDNPFQRIAGGVIRNGVLSADTALTLDNSIWWVGQDDYGKGIVWRTNGFSPQRVSTSSVERFTSTATNLSAYSYQEEGHSFYVINADEGTWAFDIKTNEWHERSYRNPITAEDERQRQEIAAFCYGKHLMADYENGQVWVQALATVIDGDQEIRRVRIFKGLDLDGRSAILDELRLDFAVGVGRDRSGQGTNPVCMLRVAPDGMNFGSVMHQPMGRIGAYDTQVRFFNLGVGRDWTFEVACSEPTVVAIMGATAVYRLGNR